MKRKFPKKIMTIWKSRMKLKRSQRLELSLKNIGNIKYKIRIKLFGQEVQMKSRKKSIISFTKVSLVIRMILLLILISRQMEESNSKVFSMFLKRLNIMPLKIIINLRVKVSNCMLGEF
jgi:hypothetical protein